MKKYIMSFIVLLIASVCFGETYTLKNNNFTLEFEKEGNNIYLSGITGYGQEFIKSAETKDGLWDLCVKAADKFDSKEILLTPKNAESCDVSLKNNILTVVWHNAKTAEMTSGFDVTAKIEMTDTDSFWSVSVSPNKEYGIWYVTYPQINDLAAQNGDEFMYPFRGQGQLIKEFSEKGFKSPSKMDGEWVKSLSYLSPLFLQFNFLTKNNVSLYMSSEDLCFYSKNTVSEMNVPNHITHKNRTYPSDMGVGNIPFAMPYKYKVTPIKGDWYDVCKYYREWGINNNAPAFRRGTIDKRPDIPKWLKNNVLWIRWHGHIGELGYRELNTAVDMLGVPCACMPYDWSIHAHDTAYPNLLPAKEGYREQIKALQKKGVKIVPYTNGHLVDMNLSDYAKSVGEDILAVDPYGYYYKEPYNADKGTDFKMNCISGPYRDIYYKEIINIMKELNIDALYMDQIGNCFQTICFNEKHNHPVGGGDHYVKAYNKLLDDLRKELTKIKGEPVPIATEDSAEAFNFDMWIRVNDSMIANIDTPMIETIFSGYTVSYGTHCYDDYASKFENYSEFKEYDNATAANHKIGVALVHGVQPGYAEAANNEINRYPYFGVYYIAMAKARYAGIEYFNLGELMRGAKIISDVPKEHVKWSHFSGPYEGDLPIVKTGAFRYNGKTMICFTNVGHRNVSFEWESNAKDLGLDNKSSYKIKEMYPVNEKETEIKEIKGKIRLLPYETKLMIVY